METNKGFKVTNKNMQCRGFQYELGKKFIHEGKIKLCKSGFHFCKRLVRCFDYYVFNPTNRVFEIEYGDAIGDEDDKMVTDSIVFLRELTWSEVLDMVNIGIGNSGHSNSGDYNTGDCNSGDYNTGNMNSGDCNSGHRNSGHWNSGDWNSGDYNTGDCNSGHRNSGHRNSGDWNSGNWNSGHRNSGNRNSGDWNSGDWNSGFLNSEKPKLRIFNKETDVSIKDIVFPNWLNFSISEWIDFHNMTDEEKKLHPSAEITGGYLKVLDYKEAAQRSYAKASKEDQDLIEQVPNYNADVLFEIFGIDRRKK